MTQGFAPLNCFLITGTTSTRPGFRPTLSAPLIGAVTYGRSGGVPVNVVTPRQGVTPAPPSEGDAVGRAHVDPAADLVTHFEDAARFFHPFSEPTNIPLVRYSRDAIAVVNGATGTCISSFAPSLRVQPSGVVRMTGRTRAPPRRAAPQLHRRLVSELGVSGRRRRRYHCHDDANATTAARRTTTAIGLTDNNLRTRRFQSRNLLGDRLKMLCVCNSYVICTPNVGLSLISRSGRRRRGLR